MADLVVPQLGESISEAIIARWLKQVGESVSIDEPIAELETDKITVQLPSPVAGALAEQRAKVGATVKVGEVIGAVAAGQQGQAAPAPAAKPPAKAIAPPNQPTGRQPTVGAAPAAVVVTRASGAPAPVPSGNGAATLDKDALLKLTPSQRAHAREAGSLPAAGPRAPAPSGPSDEARLAQIDPRDEVVPMSPLRKRVAERLVQAQHESASLTTFNEVDMTAVMDLRVEVQGRLREGARREARLHVVLRQGVRPRGAGCTRASTPR